MAMNNPTNVTTGIARLSYAHLTQPYAGMPGQEPRYSVTVLVPKTDAATKQRIDAAIEAAKQAGVSSKWGGRMPASVHVPVYDGDGVRPNGEPFGPECKGHWVFTAGSKAQQPVVDMARQPILDPTQIYSGMYAYVNVTFFPYDQAGRRGVGCGLGPVMKAADGDPLGGGVTVEDAFAGIGQAAEQAAPTVPGGVNPITGLPWGA